MILENIKKYIYYNEANLTIYLFLLLSTIYDMFLE